MSNSTKIALVTGASSGIGRAVAVALLREGYHVTLAGRREEALEETMKLAGVDASSGFVCPTDLRQADQIERLFAQARSRFGRLDVLFNNAGTNVPATPIEDLGLEQWRTVIDVNLTAVFLCTQQAVRIMKEQRPQGGRIINNGSISSHVPRPHSAPYTASKHAVAGLTKSTALDGRRYNIACGQIDIGNAETEMASKVKQGVLQAHGEIAPEPMMGVENVARAVLHMASLPLEANVLSMTVLATNMPYVGRG